MTMPAPDLVRPQPGRHDHVGTCGPAQPGRAPSQPRRPDPAIVRRRRLAAALLAMALLTALLATLSLLGNGSHAALDQVPAAPPLPAGQTTYVVRPDDTLWSIANRRYPGRDPRPLVDELASKLGGPGVAVGQRISLPAPPRATHERATHQPTLAPMETPRLGQCELGCLPAGGTARG